MFDSGRTVRLFGCSIVTALCVSTLAARELTWVGGDSGSFTEASNWSPAVSPESGDTLTFGKAVDLAEGTFDLGEGGLTVVRNAEVKCRVAFSGEGVLTLAGSGKWTVIGACTHTGGTVVSGGNIAVSVGNYVNALGTGPIEINANANAVGPCIEIGVGSGCGIEAPITFNGYIKEAIKVTNPSRFNGSLTAADGIGITVAWGTCSFNGPVSAPGNTITVSPKGDSRRQAVFNGKVEADILVSNAAGVVKFSGESQARNSKIEVASGTVMFTGAAAWSGTNVTVCSGGSVMFGGIRNLMSDDAMVHVAEGGEIEGSAGFATLPSLSVGDDVLDPGIYTSESGLGVIGGTTPFVVGGAFWTGGSEGLWSSGENWADGAVPKGGCVAVFTNDVTLAEETFDFGTDGVSVANDSAVVLKTSFAGDGVFRKIGPGDVKIGVENSYTGGTVVEGGTVSLSDSKLESVLGTGPLRLNAVSGSTSVPGLKMGSWGMTLSVPVSFEGSFPSGARAVELTNHGVLNNGLSADSDVVLWMNYGPLTVNGKIDAPGYTVAVRTALEKNDGVDRGFTSEFKGEIDASILKKGPGRLALSGVSPSEENSITVEEGTLILRESAVWAGSVAVSANGVMRATDAGNLSRSSAVTVASGGTVEVAEGVRVDVASLVVDGQALGPGTYSAANLPDTITGGGRMRVYRQTFNVVIR